MARIRNIPPSLLLRIRKLSLHAQGLILRLPIACDDAGRAKRDLRLIAKVLFPDQPDVPGELPGWLEELEREGFVERYEVESVHYLRLVNWFDEQTICHPTPSALPPSPNEPPAESRNSRRSRARGGANQKETMDQVLGGLSAAFLENAVDEGDHSRIVIDRKTLLRVVGRTLVNADSDGAHSAALKAAELLAKFGGVVAAPVAPPMQALTPMAATPEAAAEAEKAAAYPDPVQANACMAGD